ncbi:MAG: polysaccharide pyruvyl transferase family protein [Lachnospiraceae bacterium]|nr:polysaccharide pyruvyl transferase family protein [Lachnospiraceae bacterium]
MLNIEEQESEKKGRRIGVVTIYDLGNYGNRLQNYAVIRYLSNMGYDAETLIIKQNNAKEVIKKVLDVLKIRKASKHWNLRQESKEYVAGLSEQGRQRYRLFKDFSYKYTNIKKISYWRKVPWQFRKQYDYFIAGSDQIWNPTIGHGVDWEFLSFSKRDKNISWSASFGISDIPENFKAKFKKYLRNVGHISVREDTGVTIVKDLTNRRAELLLDPTMMITSDEWRSLAEAPKTELPGRYILSFFLGGQDDKRREQIKALADKNGCEVINLMDEECEVLYKTGPAQFIYLVEHASLVCTDSFHACVFSILLDKAFYAFDRLGEGMNMSTRITNLLGKFELKDRMFDTKKADGDAITHNYDHVYEILGEERQKTRKFLKKALIER